MTTEPKWLSVARGELGTREIEGAKSNSRIVEYAKVAVGVAAPDSEAWCARFVGWCLAKDGLAETDGTRKSNARSYLEWGEKLDEPRPGCVVVFWRVSKTSWQGHVAFWLKQDATHVWCLGGNQGNAVSIARYPKSQVLGYRWPTHAAAPPAPQAEPQPDAALKQVQLRLKALGYHEVGTPDGFPGTRTRGALLAFKADWNEHHPDSALPMDASIADETLAALMAAEPRRISVERETAPESKIGDYAAIKEAKKVGLIGKITAWGGAAWVAIQSGVADQISSASYALQAVRDAIVPFWPVIKPILPFLIIGGAIAVVIWVRRIRKEEVESHRMGETP